MGFHKLRALLMLSNVTSMPFPSYISLSTSIHCIIFGHVTQFVVDVYY